jgi:broad specificity phosphatase PhoE
VTEARLILVRHGVTDWNREGRFQGHRDPPLGTAGRHEAKLVAERLAADDRLRPARILTSTLSRARETADVIAAATGAPVEGDPRLIEIGQGDWEGRTHAELEVDDAARYEAWLTAPGIRRPPGGEAIEAATRRVGDVLAELEAGEAWPVCVVSHGGTLRLLADALLGLGGLEAQAFDVDNASVSVAARIGGAWRLERWNDALHLLGREPTHVDEAEGRPLAL